jgi:hypothetical protein
VAVYLNGYESNSPGKLLRSHWCAEGLWNMVASPRFNMIVMTGDSPTEVRDNLSQHLDENDELWVAAIGRTARIGFNSKGSDWLMSNL